MNDDYAGKVIGALVIAGAILTVRGLVKADLSGRTYIGLGIVAFFLLAVGAFSPELASALALLVLVVVLLSSASDISALLRFVKGS